MLRVWIQSVVTLTLLMKNLLSKVLEDILTNVPKDKIDERIMKFKRNMSMLHYDVMGNPIGVKGIGKYEVKDTDSPFSTFRKEHQFMLCVRYQLQFIIGILV